jgi:hypothetical protein
MLSQALVAQAYNPSYGGRDQEDLGSQQIRRILVHSWANSKTLILKKTHHKIGGVAPAIRVPSKCEAPSTNSNNINKKQCWRLQHRMFTTLVWHSQILFSIHSTL